MIYLTCVVYSKNLFIFTMVESISMKNEAMLQKCLGMMRWGLERKDKEW